MSEAPPQSDPPTILKPVRIVRMCAHKDCLPPYRRFFFTEEEAERWSCPDHGKAHVRVQVNKPYARPVV